MYVKLQLLLRATRIRSDLRLMSAFHYRTDIINVCDFFWLFFQLWWIISWYNECSLLWYIKRRPKLAFHLLAGMPKVSIIKNRLLAMRFIIRGLEKISLLLFCVCFRVIYTFCKAAKMPLDCNNVYHTLGTYISHFSHYTNDIDHNEIQFYKDI